MTLKKNMWIWQIDELILSMLNRLCFVLLKATGYEYLTPILSSNSLNAIKHTVIDWAVICLNMMLDHTHNKNKLKIP